MAKKRRPKKFSVTAAVKANARERVGQPRAARVIDDKPLEEKRKRRYKETLGKLLSERE